MRISTVLLEIAEENRRVTGSSGKITMSREGLRIMAAALEADLGARGGVIYRRPYEGFKFDGIEFCPEPTKLARDGFKPDTPITAEAIEGRLVGEPWPIPHARD